MTLNFPLLTPGQVIHNTVDIINACNWSYAL